MVQFSTQSTLSIGCKFTQVGHVGFGVRWRPEDRCSTICWWVSNLYVAKTEELVACNRVTFRCAITNEWAVCGNVICAVDERVLFSANTLFSPLEGVNEPGAHIDFHEQS